MAEYQPDVRRVGSLASHLWNWLPPGKRNKWTYEFLDVVPTRKEKRYAYGICSWAAWILLGADGLFPKRIYNSVQIVWALQIAIDELRGIGCGERNMARWSELDNVLATRDYMDGAGLQANLDNMADSAMRIYTASDVEGSESGAVHLCCTIVDIFTIKVLGENQPKMEAIALKLLDCLQGEMPKTVRQEIKARKKIEKMYEKLYRKAATN